MSQPETYREVIRRIHGQEPVGEPEEQVRVAEARLGIALPRTLRDCYLFASHQEPCNSTHDRLLGPGTLRMAGGALLFYEENEGVNYWGIRASDLDQEDPPVVAAWNEEPMRWEIDHDRLSGFLATMAYWQAVNGAVPNFALGLSDASLLATIERHWPEIDTGGHRWGLRIFSRDGQAICLLGDEAGEGQVHVGGRTAQDLRAIQERLSVEWDVEEVEG